MLMLIDYSSLLFRAFHSLPDTVPMQGFLGFLNMLARLLADRRPDRLGVAVDDDWRPAFRTDALPSYKARRRRPSAARCSRRSASPSSARQATRPRT